MIELTAVRECDSSPMSAAVTRAQQRQQLCLNFDCCSNSSIVSFGGAAENYIDLFLVFTSTAIDLTGATHANYSTCF